MNFERWEPVYDAILSDFGYDPEADQHARDRLYATIEDQQTLDVGQLRMDAASVAIAGAGPSLEDDCEMVRTADIVVAASTAAGRLREAGLAVDCVVTDLDKHESEVVSLSREEVPVVVHAHGDNIQAIERVVPKVASRVLVPTTQAKPRPPVRNFGGFTDGDRAAFLADAMGATELTFPGWDFEDATVGPEKARKLQWAERLLYWLERRRGDHFAVLDGRRNGIDTSLLPV